ncbi:MAG: metallophosphoesterase [Polyangiaceae bacterium]
MNPQAVVDEIRARLQLMARSSTLTVAVSTSDATLAEERTALLGLLGATPLHIVDLGRCDTSTGPRKWVEMARATPADAYALSFLPESPLAIKAFGRLLNAERELLRDLGAPFLLFTSAPTEQGLRDRAPDFFTWTSAYELPPARDLQALASPLGVAPASVYEKAPLEEPIRFLHISDIHLRPGLVKRYDQDRVLSGLVAFLERDRAHFPLDLIFVTGDLAQSGRAEEYTLVSDLLRKLLEITGVPRERMFVVPGNHDVDRGAGVWLLRTLAKDEESVAFFTDPASREFHGRKMAAYHKEMASLLGEGRPLGMAVGEDAVETIDIKGSRLSVASFNTAWFAQGDDDTGKLWLGEPNVERAIGRIADDGADIAIALMHHPFDNLHETERDNVERWVERGFDLLLRGHLHASKTRTIVSQRGGFVEVASPATYQGSPWQNGCFLGEIRPRARKIRLRPYMYTAGPDPWVLDPKVFPDDEESGYCREFKVPPKPRLKSATSKALKKAAEKIVKGASPAAQQRILEQTSPGTSVPPPEGPERRAISTVRALADSPELWTETLGESTPGLELLHAVVREAEKEEWHSRRTAAKSASLSYKQALKLSARLLVQTLRGRTNRPTMKERDVELVFYALLELFSDAKIAFHSVPPKHARRIITMGHDTMTPLAIELESGRRRKDLLEGAAHLDLYASEEPTADLALVLINSLPPEAQEPEFTRGKTPRGRDMLIVRI